MKKNIIILLIVVILVVLAFSIIRFYNFGVKKIYIENSRITLTIPKIAKLKSVSKNYVEFSSLQNKDVITNSLESIYSGLESKICNNKKVYYDDKNNITITDYRIEESGLITKFYINYRRGNISNDECSIVKNPKKIKYQIEEAQEGNICTIPSKFNYRNSDGNLYNVYYICFGNLWIQTGMNEMNYLNQMLYYGWISMQDMIDFMEYQVKIGEASQKKYSGEKTILYQNRDFSMLVCDTSIGNKDIYIGDTSLKYEENYCQ